MTPKLCCFELGYVLCTLYEFWPAQLLENALCVNVMNMYNEVIFPNSDNCQLENEVKFYSDLNQSEQFYIFKG